VGLFDRRLDRDHQFPAPRYAYFPGRRGGASLKESPEIVLEAPHTTRVSRMDETAAARKPVLRRKPQPKEEVKEAEKLEAAMKV